VQASPALRIGCFAHSVESCESLAVSRIRASRLVENPWITQSDGAQTRHIDVRKTDSDVAETHSCLFERHRRQVFSNARSNPGGTGFPSLAPRRESVEVKSGSDRMWGAVGERAASKQSKYRRVILEEP